MASSKEDSSCSDVAILLFVAKRPKGNPQMIYNGRREEVQQFRQKWWTIEGQEAKRLVLASFTITHTSFVQTCHVKGSPVTIPRSALMVTVSLSASLMCSCHVCLPDEVPDVRECLSYLRGLWPRAAFDDRLPPVVMKHQLYSLCPNRTGVDHQVVSARTSCPSR